MLYQHNRIFDGGFGFVSKLDGSGKLVYSIYLGGDINDLAFGIAVDKNGNAYVAGRTVSSTFPKKNPFQATLAGQSDAFVTKLNSTGTGLVYSTYLGGSNWDDATAIAVDKNGSAYVTGSTSSQNLDITPGAFQTTLSSNSSDAFVTKFSAAGNTLVYSTLLGGTGLDEAKGIAIDTSGNAYVAGATKSNNFDTTPGAYDTSYGGDYDVFVKNFNSSGKAPLVYSTYLGKGSQDIAYGIAVDSLGNAFVAGKTSSSKFPVAGGGKSCQIVQSKCGSFCVGMPDAFVTKFNAAGSNILYSTYLGSDGASDHAFAIATDSSGNVYMTGSTGSGALATKGAYDTKKDGAMDAFATKLSSMKTFCNGQEHCEVFFTTRLAYSLGDSPLIGIP